MKMKSVKKVLVPVLLIALFSVFLGCDLAVGGLQMGDVTGRSSESAAASVGAAEKGKGPTYFTATVNMYQDYTSVITQDMGNSDHPQDDRRDTVQCTIWSVWWSYRVRLGLVGR